jgi:hypothetical protein
MSLARRSRGFCLWGDDGGWGGGGRVQGEGLKVFWRLIIPLELRRNKLLTSPGAARHDCNVEHGGDEYVVCGEERRGKVACAPQGLARGVAPRNGQVGLQK